MIRFFSICIAIAVLSFYHTDLAAVQEPHSEPGIPERMPELTIEATGTPETLIAKDEEEDDEDDDDSASAPQSDFEREFQEEALKLHDYVLIPNPSEDDIENFRDFLALNRKRRYKGLKISTAEQHRAIGVASFYETNDTDALHAFKESLKLDPDNARTWYNIGVIYERTGVQKEAFAALNKSSDLNPEYSLPHCKIGTMLIGYKAYEQALEPLDEALRLDPELFEALYNKGVALEKLKKYEEAMEPYLKALEINDDYQDLLTHLAYTSLKLDKMEDAEKYIDESLDQDDENPDALVVHARILNAKGEKEGALEELAKALEKNERHLDAWMAKADLLIEQEKYEEALDAYDQALLCDPRDPNIWRGKGTVLYRLGKLPEALAMFNIVIDKRSDLIDARLNRAIILIDLERYEEAVETCEKILGMNDSIDDAYALRSVAFIKMEQYKEALDSANRAMQINDKNTVARESYEKAQAEMAKINAEKENDNESITAIFENALAASETRSEEELIAAVHELIEKKDMEQADSLAEILIKKYPESQDGWMIKGETAELMLRREDALDAYDAVINLNPEHTQALLRKSAILLQQNNDQEALDIFEKILAYDTENIEAMKGKARSLLHLGYDSEALEVLNTVINTVPGDEEALQLRKNAERSVEKTEESVVPEEPANETPSEADPVMNSFQEGLTLLADRLYDQALDAFNQTIFLDPNHALAWYNKARVFAIQGKTDDAIESLTTALDLDPALKYDIDEDEHFESLRGLDSFKALTE
ncbi:MAG: tetratricopeptide repeat protein [Candidatus Auribacterota bacterium]